MPKKYKPRMTVVKSPRMDVPSDTPLAEMLSTVGTLGTPEQRKAKIHAALQQKTNS